MFMWLVYLVSKLFCKSLKSVLKHFMQRVEFKLFQKQVKLILRSGEEE